MTGDPTVLGMINDNLKEIKDEQKKITSCMTGMKVDVATTKVKVDNLETDVKDLKTGQKKIKKEMFNHAIDKKVHYNQGYKETFPQRVYRKKGELGLIGTAVTIITLIINHFYGG